MSTACRWLCAWRVVAMAPSRTESYRILGFSLLEFFLIFVIFFNYLVDFNLASFSIAEDEAPGIKHRGI